MHGTVIPLMMTEKDAILDAISKKNLLFVHLRSIEKTGIFFFQHEMKGSVAADI